MELNKKTEKGSAADQSNAEPQIKTHRDYTTEKEGIQ